MASSAEISSQLALDNTYQNYSYVDEKSLFWFLFFTVHVYNFFFLLFYLPMQDNEQQIAEMKKISSFLFITNCIQVLIHFVNENGPKASKTTCSIEYILPKS